MKSSRIVALIVGLTSISAINISSILVTNVVIDSQYKKPLSYAVGSTYPQDTIDGLQQVKKWFEDNYITQGSTCIYIDNPYCDLSKFYHTRIVKSIELLEEIKEKNDPLATSNLLLQIKDSFHNKGELIEPENLNLRLRWGGYSIVGWWIDLLSYVILIAGATLVISLLR
ncbi:hypothetical protein H6G33_09995 [Calothrix sp. FACHB-1219]|uniref:hypothetical protein n=1 Tax=unclassified Calothrix TaxID=2619626 RepID=UPI001686FEBD|nr:MULTISPECIES: hypothetical protein [unclassified Calothrix]MBD2201678.1 hypothetical protein [Calothrix sp. FACHB-168]MBD2217364.1 hypothetical protein [Calothrix sp. FACHB-1219]